MYFVEKKKFGNKIELEIINTHSKAETIVISLSSHCWYKDPYEYQSRIILTTF